jgi:hypothetical protein
MREDFNISPMNWHNNCSVNVRKNSSMSENSSNIICSEERWDSEVFLKSILLGWGDEEIFSGAGIVGKTDLNHLFVSFLIFPNSLIIN